MSILPRVRWHLNAEHRSVVLVAVTVRLAGLIGLAYALPLAWPFLPHPGWSRLLDLLLVAEAALSVGRWWEAGTVGRRTLAVTVPPGVGAIFAAVWLAQGAGSRGFTNYVYPYTILLAFVLGLAARTGVNGELLLEQIPYAELWVPAD